MIEVPATPPNPLEDLTYHVTMYDDGTAVLTFEQVGGAQDGAGATVVLTRATLADFAADLAEAMAQHRGVMRHREVPGQTTIEDFTGGVE